MQHFTVCLFTVLSKLKAAGRPIDHQASTRYKSDTMGRCDLNQRYMKMLIVCMSFFTKGVQNVHNLHGHMPGDAFSTGQLQCR